MGTNHSLQMFRCRGVTLTELLVVVIILGMLAAVATPGLRSADPAKLDLAATMVAEALRFARSESKRTGVTHGVTVNQTTQRVRVREYDLTTDPVSGVATLYHPVTRRPYDFDFDTESTTMGVRVSNAQDPFDFTGIARRKTILFNSNGVPMWIVASGPTTHNLAPSAVELSAGDVQRTVTVAPYTGRVTVQ